MRMTNTIKAICSNWVSRAMDASVFGRSRMSRALIAAATKPTGCKGVGSEWIWIPQLRF